nr:PqqD family protein [Tabrizicola sp.]
RLIDAEPVLELLPNIAAGWLFQVQPVMAHGQPFMTIRGQADGARFHCENHLEPGPVRSWDAVNAAGEAMAALALALPAEDSRIISLHAAAVEMAGRLVVFPNVRRAGKSTLAAALAFAGHPVFTDDVLPLRFADNGSAQGVAMGLAQRLRMPLPPAAPAAMQAWVTGMPGPENRQYKYLLLPDQPRHGEALPIGAFVILDRQEEVLAARLDRVRPDQAMDALLHQNFTRDRHSQDVLQAICTMLSGRPVFQLQYSDLADAVSCLRHAFTVWPEDLVPTSTEARTFRMAEFPDRSPVPIRDDLALRQRPGCGAMRLGETLYLADPEGGAIHRMDSLAAEIWSVLGDAASPGDLKELLAAAFPDTDPGVMAQDLDRLLQSFAVAGLIEEGGVEPYAAGLFAVA